MIGLDIPSHHGWKAKRARALAARADREAKAADPERQRVSRILAQHESRSRLEVAIQAAQREADEVRAELTRAEAMVDRIRIAIPAAEQKVDELRASLAAFEIQAAADNAEGTR